MTTFNKEDKHVHIQGNDYYKVTPIRAGSCEGCARQPQPLPCSGIGCDGEKHNEPEFILIDYNDEALARYVTDKLSTT